MNERIMWDEITQDLLNEFTEQPENGFIRAMIEVAGCQVGDKKQICNKDKVNEAIAQMVLYVMKNKSANYAVNNMFGFAEKKVSGVNNSDNEEAWIKVFEQMSVDSVKEYLYFVADMKIKATVYLMRVHNFIKNGGLEHIYETKDTFVSEIEDITIEDINLFFDTELGDKSKKIIELEEVMLSSMQEKVSDYIKLCKKFISSENDTARSNIADKLIKIERDIMEEREKEEKWKGALPAFLKYHEIVDKERDNLLSDAKYYLFDNSMQEVNFVGVGWKWLWKYEPGEADLFRCSNGEDVYTYKGDIHANGRTFYQQMIRNVVAHMNKGEYKSKLASYSKDPYRDIYKYMSLHKRPDEEYFFEVFKDEADEVQVELRFTEGEVPYKDGNVTFAMVKKAKTNIIKPLTNVAAGQIVDYTLSIDGEKVKGHATAKDAISFSKFITDSSSEEAHIFCIDIFNNPVRYSGDVRKVFKEYVSQFPDVNVNGVQLSVVSPNDKEVVMLGNTCDRIVRLDKECNAKYDELGNNIEYRVVLSGKEIIRLFKRIGDNDNMPEFKITEKIGGDKKVHYYAEKNKCEIEIKGVQELLEQGNSFMEGEDEKQRTERVQKGKEKVKKHIRELISAMLENICAENENEWKLQFIEQFIKKYDDRQNYKKATVYKEGDQFVDFCREVYMK